MKHENEENEKECKITTTFIGRACQKCAKCLGWSKMINVVVFASASDICFVIPKVIIINSISISF